VVCLANFVKKMGFKKYLKFFSPFRNSNFIEWLAAIFYQAVSQFSGLQFFKTLKGNYL
jgi:hypothetical protein